jgi:hypothetical protein
VSTLQRLGAHTYSAEPCWVVPCLADPCAVAAPCPAVHAHRPVVGAAAVVGAVVGDDVREGGDSYTVEAPSSQEPHSCRMEQN